MTQRDPPPDELRCEWIRLSNERCRLHKRNDDPSGRWCPWHEDAAVQRVRNWQRAQYVEDVSIEEHLQMELKMCLVQLRELEFQVLDLGLSLDAYEKETVETETREGEDPKNSYVSVKKARLLGAHPVILHYLREREHHMNVLKTCVSAGIAAKQIAVVERYVEASLASHMALAESLGHDPADPVTRAAIMDVIRRQLSELQESTGTDLVRELEQGTGQ